MSSASPVRSAPSVLLALCALAAGCAGDLVNGEGGFQSRSRGFRIAAPGGPGGDWREIHLEGALLAFRRDPAQTLSFQSDCSRPVAAPAVMARHLLIGLSNREAIRSGGTLVDGRDAWSQTFDVAVDRDARDGDVIRFKTVTLVVERCSYDWLLAAAVSRSAAGSFEAAELAFDAWWGSFRLEPGGDVSAEPAESRQ